MSTNAAQMTQQECIDYFDRMRERVMVKHAAGDIVRVVDTPRHNGVWRVERVNAQSYTLVNGSGTSLRCDKTCVVSAQPGDRLAEPTWTPVLGSVVTITGYPGKYVVLATAGTGFRVAKLGGDSNRYLKSVPAAMLVPATAA